MMTHKQQIEEAVDQLSREEFYLDMGVASIADTVETIILAKPQMALFQAHPSLAAQHLIARLGTLPLLENNLTRIACFVILGRLQPNNQKPTISALTDWLKRLPDSEISRCRHITHPFRYALSALQHINRFSLGLGPGEDLNMMFERRHSISRQMEAL